MRFALLGLFLVLFEKAYSQVTACDTVHRIVNQMPTYRSGYEDLANDLKKLSVSPGCPAEELQQVIWIIDKEGKVAFVDVVGPSENCKENVITHAKTLTDWKPGKLNGKLVCVRVVYSLHIRPGRFTNE